MENTCGRCEEGWGGGGDVPKKLLSLTFDYLFYTYNFVLRPMPTISSYTDCN